MYDYEKMQYLLKNGNFIFNKNIKTITKKRTIIYPLIINQIISSFNSELKSLGENYELHNYNINRSHKEFHEHYLTLIKENTSGYEDLYSNYFGKESSNIFTYLNQIIMKQPNHKKFFEGADESFYLRCRYHVAKCANVSIDTLKASSKEEFITLLEEDDGFKETNESFDINAEEPFDIYEFNCFSLEKVLTEKNFDDNFIGLNQLNSFKYPIPDFFDDNCIKDNKLQKHIYIEGFYGTGKTTLSQQIAFNISKKYSYYFDFKLYDEKYDMQTQVNNITPLLKFISINQGVVILDNININSYTKYITSIFLKESEKLGLKLIFIAKLEQHNTISKTHTFFDIYTEQEIYLENNCFKIELSSSQNHYKNRINILKNFLLNYLPIKEKENLFPLDSKTLDKLDKEFNGLLYLLKVSIDNQDFNVLEELTVESADSIIHTKYNELLNDLDNKYVRDFIVISSLNLFMRVDQLFYNKYFILKNKLFKELHVQKLLYIIKDIKFNSNYVIYFPNHVIPLKLAEFISIDKNYNLSSLLTSSENINSMLKLGA